MSPSSRSRKGTSLAAIAAFVLVAALSQHGLSPPSPAAGDAAPDEFSAERAYDMLSRVLGDGRPHPTGSAANAAVRDRVLAEFEHMGYSAEVRRRFVCNRWDSCATVDNILAQLPGTGGEPGVLLATHYDSVASGPGAGDAGAGVAAIMEVARTLRAGPDLPRSVWFLIGDGEEVGLLSAEAFVREPEFAAIGSVVNLEARGTSGPSQLFETQSGNAAIVSLASEALPDPVGSSLAYEIYKHMPNNTDFTVFRREGLVGVNFAFTGGPSRYHTPLDNLDHLSLGSLQHHGDNALAMARSLATNAEPVAVRDRVFFDLFGAALVGWPVRWNFAMLASGLIGWIALAVRSARRGQLRPLRLLAACLLMPLLPVAAMVLAIGLQAALAGTDSAAASWTAQGEMLVFAFMMLAVAVCALSARPAQRWVGEAALSLSTLSTFALLAIAAVVVAPGTSFLPLLPLIAGVLTGHAWLSRPATWGGAAAVFTAMLWYPFAYLSYEALGYDALPGVALLMALALLPLLPALAGLARGAPLAAGAALTCLAALAAVAVARPAFTADVPQSLNLLYVSAGDGGRLFADSVTPDNRPPDLMRIGGFESEPVESLPWSDRPRLAGRAGPAIPAPELEILRDTPTAEGRRLHLQLRSLRDARVLFLVLPMAAKPDAMRVEQEPVAPPEWLAGSPWRTIEIVAPPADGVRIDLELRTREPVSFYAADASDGLPVELADVVDARNAAAAPIGAGDRTIAWREVHLPDS
ncbi:MAG: M28 family peptidase [Gammaproteobacteria bacterium]